MNKPHKHAELIKAWADGAKAQVKIGGDWYDIVDPVWDISNEYRIKPEPPKAEWMFVDGVRPEGLSDDTFVEWFGVSNFSFPDFSPTAQDTGMVGGLCFNNPGAYKVMFIRVVE